MKLVIQRVKNASVSVDNKIVGKINQGLLVLLGIKNSDTKKDVDYLVRKLINLRIFNDKNNKMNLSIQSVNGELLIISQFTLYGDCKKSGNRPSFSNAAKSDIASPLYEYFVSECKKQIPVVQTGIFGTDMKVKDLADMFSKSGYFIVVGISLLVTSLLLFIGDLKNKHTVKVYQEKGMLKDGAAGRKKYNVLDAITVGITQCFAALFPGVSRSGSTLVASELRGINKQAALDYSFLRGTPAIVAAAIIEGKDALFPKDGQSVSIDYLPVIVGMIIAALVGFFAIKLFKWLLKTDRMYVFIIYTAIVGAAITTISIIELTNGTNIITGQPLVF